MGHHVVYHTSAHGLGEDPDMGLRDHFPQPRLWLLLHLLPSLALYWKTTLPHRQVRLPQLHPHTEVTWGP